MMAPPVPVSNHCADIPRHRLDTGLAELGPEKCKVAAKRREMVT